MNIYLYLLLFESYYYSLNNKITYYIIITIDNYYKIFKVSIFIYYIVYI